MACLETSASTTKLSTLKIITLSHTVAQLAALGQHWPAVRMGDTLLAKWIVHVGGIPYQMMCWVMHVAIKTR